MGIRGPAPEPSALRLARGNPSRRPLNASEPQYDSIIVPCPADMPEVGQSLWNEIYGAMTEAGVLKKTDVRTLEAHCRAWALYKRADTEMNEGSMVQVAESGYTAPTAWLTIRSKAFQEFSKTGAELGLTPASRTRIRADDGAKPEPMIPTRQREA